MAVDTKRYRDHGYLGIKNPWPRNLSFDFKRWVTQSFLRCSSARSLTAWTRAELSSSNSSKSFKLKQNGLSNAALTVPYNLSRYRYVPWVICKYYLQNSSNGSAFQIWTIVWGLIKLKSIHSLLYLHTNTSAHTQLWTVYSCGSDGWNGSFWTVEAVWASLKVLDLLSCEALVCVLNRRSSRLGPKRSGVSYPYPSLCRS